MKISPLPYDKNRLLQFPCGTFKDLTVTGMEALAIKEVATSFKVNYGYVYNGRSEKYMKDFVNHFYERKRNAKNPVDYMLNKTIQNSLYGKTIQLNTSRIEIGGYVCGQGFRKSIKVKNPAGMFNPVIASWITAISRLNLYHEMKRNEPYVLYCDTDSIATTRKCPQLEDSKDLGKFAKEKTGSHFYLVREKRYILKDKKILKSGRHAFRGSEELFNECLMNETDSYAVKRMIQLREAKIQQKQAFEMEFRNFVMTNEPSDKRTKPNLNFKNFKKKFYWLKPFFVFEKENIQEIVQKKTKARKYQISMIPITKTQIPYRELYVRNFFASTKKRS